VRWMRTGGAAGAAPTQLVSCARRPWMRTERAPPTSEPAGSTIPAEALSCSWGDAGVEALCTTRSEDHFHVAADGSRGILSDVGASLLTV